MANDLHNCIDLCQRCHSMCLNMASTHCLQKQGDHIKPEHFRLMLACAKICQTAADFMLIESNLHGAVCKACATVCTACAQSCERLDGMEECAKICRECADSCNRMAVAA